MLKTVVVFLLFLKVALILSSCDHKSVEEMYAKADFYERKNDLKTANIIYEEIIRDYEDCLGAFINKGANCSIDSNYYKAISVYKRGLKKFSKNTTLHWNVASNYFRLNKLDSAIHYYSQGIKYAEKCDTYTGPEIELRDASEIEENVVESYEFSFERGLIYYDLGEYNKTISDMQECIRCGYYVAYCHYVIGLCLENQGKFNECCVEFLIASDLGLDEAKSKLEKDCPEDMDFGADKPLSNFKTISLER